MTEVKKGTNWKLLIPVAILAFAFGYFLWTNRTQPPINVVAEPLAYVVEQGRWYLTDPTRIADVIKTNQLGYSIMTSFGGSVMWIAGKVFYGRIIGNKDLTHKNDLKTISALNEAQEKLQSAFTVEKGTLNTQLTDANQRVVLAEKQTELTEKLLKTELAEKDVQIKELNIEKNQMTCALGEKYIITEKRVQ